MKTVSYAYFKELHYCSDTTSAPRIMRSGKFAHSEPTSSHTAQKHIFMLTSSSDPTNKATFFRGHISNLTQRRAENKARQRDIHFSLSLSELRCSSARDIIHWMLARRESGAKLDLFSLWMKTTAKFQQQQPVDKRRVILFYFCSQNNNAGNDRLARCISRSRPNVRERWLSRLICGYTLQWHGAHSRAQWTSKRSRINKDIIIRAATSSQGQW